MVLSSTVTEGPALNVSSAEPTPFAGSPVTPSPAILNVPAAIMIVSPAAAADMAA
jgi:hypothetical protein